MGIWRWGQIFLDRERRAIRPGEKSRGSIELRRILKDYFAYYHRWRTHQSLEMDSPEGRQTEPIDRSRVVEIDEVGGLHHHYVRVAA